MGVPSSTNRVVLAGDGATLTFPFGYYFFNQSDLNVWVYDKVAGGTVSKVLGTDYTISGTANAQGLYPNGATVVFSVAPLSTVFVVITRNPPEVQNYALAQNGQISSVALVQQLDYLTLLCQRLQDQVSRAVMLPDGMGASFSAALPSNAALSGGAPLIINPGGTGISLGISTMNSWQSIILPYTIFQAASTNSSTLVLTLPASCLLAGLVIKHSSAFTGASISDVYMNIGTAGDASKFVLDFDVLAAPSDSNYDSVLPGFIGSFANTTAINISANSVGANLNALTTGSVTVYFLYQLI